MHRLRFLGFLLLSTLVVGGGSAQNSARDKSFSTFSPKPVWTLEYIEVKPGMFGPAMGYLDDNWMRVRQEAKQDGAVLTFFRIAEQASDKNDWHVVLITEFKDADTYASHETLFDSIIKRLPQNASGVIGGFGPDDLFQSDSTRRFQDFSESTNPQFRLLSKM